MIDIIRIIENKTNRKFKEGEDYTLEIISPEKRIYTITSEELKKLFHENIDFIYGKIFRGESGFSTFSYSRNKADNIILSLGETEEERKKREAKEAPKRAQRKREQAEREREREERLKERKKRNKERLVSSECDCCEEECNKGAIYYFEKNGEWFFACSLECYEKLYSGESGQQGIIQRKKLNSLGKQTTNNSQPNKFTDYLPWIIGLSVVGTLIFVGFLRWLSSKKGRK